MHKLLLQSNMQSHMGFQLGYIDLTVAHSKGRGQSQHSLIVNISKIVTNNADISVANKDGVTSWFSISIFGLACSKDQGQACFKL